MFKKKKERKEGISTNRKRKGKEPISNQGKDKKGINTTYGKEATKVPKYLLFEGFPLSNARASGFRAARDAFKRNQKTSRVHGFRVVGVGCMGSGFRV